MTAAPKSSLTPQPPLTVGGCATLACLWEATAAKPGNVYRGADFDDLSYADFVASAAVIGPIVERAAADGVGATVLAAVEATQAAVGTNTNLGILLLIVPLAAVPLERPLADGIGDVLAALTVDDSRHAYAAIRAARPGGLGKAPDADVNDAAPPTITLREAMLLAADRDLVARQYANGFSEVFWAADRIAAAAATRPWGAAIVHAFLELLAAQPDSLIARKAGLAAAEEVSGHAREVLESLRHGNDVFQAIVADFDFWLRADGRRRNPGTSADVIAAALFVLLRERRVDWPVRFY